MKEVSNSALGTPSKRQAEVLSFVQKFITKKGFSPSISEVADALGITAPTAHQHITALTKKELTPGGG
jgi:SOS-response transcriptional repressor LexA